MKKLTRREELDIISELTQKVWLSFHGGYLDYGSSRVVFDFGKDKVVKVALGREGVFQNKNEVQLVREFGDQRLAKIYAYSDNLIIAEKLKVFDSEGIERSYNFYSNPDEFWVPFERKEIDDLIKTIDYINDVIGYTEDNFQVGQDKYGNFKSYDYGYSKDAPHESQVGSVDIVIDSGKLGVEMDYLCYSLGME